MTKEEYEDRILNLVKNSLPFNEYLQVFTWLNSHRKVEDLESRIEGLYKFGVAEIRTTIDLDNRYDITAQVANALTNEIKKPLLEEIAKQKEILDAIKPIFDNLVYLSTCGDFFRTRYLINNENGFHDIEEEQYNLLKEWKEE